MRPFSPPSFGINRPDFHAALIEMRLAQSGEYVLHKPAGKPPQWVVMNYQFIPVSASTTGDYLVNGANPQLWGYVDHFADKPELYRDGDSIRPEKGSQFEVRGFLYSVKKVDINHVGYVHIDLVQADKCSEARAGFFAEQAGLVCQPQTSCL